ncbi:MAG: hypothetical protein NT136_03415 [Candidatus Moranbacteria bacterium]|nr:hypothetical protein [Candidatus Moranbacteria bacterium]
MQLLLKHTYLMDVSKINADLKRLWKRYQAILKKPNWNDLNEARAILYLIGQIYCERIAPEAIERRLHLLKKPLKINTFLLLIDSKSKKLAILRKDSLFAELEKFYILAKGFKNKFVGGKYYLDEEKFIGLYNRYSPNRNIKVGYKGKF